MSNGDTADPTTSGTLSTATPSDSRSLKEDGHSIEAGVKSNSAVRCEHDETRWGDVKRMSDLADTLPSTSEGQSTCFDSNSSYRQSLCKSSSAGKRKAALPRKRPAVLEEPVNISADTGEVVDDESMSANGDVMGANDDTVLIKAGLRRMANVRKKAPIDRFSRSPNSLSTEALQSDTNPVETGLDCSLFGIFPNVASCLPAEGSSNNFASKDVHMGTDKSPQTAFTGNDCGFLRMPLKADPDGSSSSMQIRTEKGSTKRRKEEMHKGCPIAAGALSDSIVKLDSVGNMEATTEEFLRKDASMRSKKNAMQTRSSATAMLNGLCGNNVATIQDLFLNVPSPTAINAAMSGLLLAGAGKPLLGGATDMNTLGSLSASDLLTATAATGMLPFMGANLAEVSADSQKLQMALIEAATAAASNTLCGLIGGANVVAGEREKSGIGLLKQQQSASAVPSTSTKQSAGSLMIPAVMLNGRENTCLVNSKASGSSAQQLDSSSEGLCIGLPLSTVLPEVNGAQDVIDVGDHLMRESRLAFTQKLLAGDDETLRGDAPKMTREDRIDLEELENFAQTFKKQRIKFGFTQGDVGMALGRRYGTDFSQTTISRFEALNLSFKNMCKLRPLLKEWLADAEAAIANGATASDLLEAQKNDPSAPQVGTSSGLPPSSAVISAVEESPSPNGSCVGTSGIPLRKRRKRTNLDSTQRAALDGYFQMNPRPDHDRMAQIAATLELDRDVVRVWFCNRRQKLRRE